jgi:hypothetical protein
MTNLKLAPFSKITPIFYEYLRLNSSFSPQMPRHRPPRHLFHQPIFSITRIHFIYYNKQDNAKDSNDPDT